MQLKPFIGYIRKIPLWIVLVVILSGITFFIIIYYINNIHIPATTSDDVQVVWQKFIAYMNTRLYVGADCPYLFDKKYPFGQQNYRDLTLLDPQEAQQWMLQNPGAAFSLWCTLHSVLQHKSSVALTAYHESSTGRALVKIDDTHAVVYVQMMVWEIPIHFIKRGNNWYINNIN